MNQAKRSLLLVIGEEIDITYSYWDGSGHRRHIKVCVCVCVLMGGGYDSYLFLFTDAERKHNSTVSSKMS